MISINMAVLMLSRSLQIMYTYKYLVFLCTILDLFQTLMLKFQNIW